MVWKPRAYRKYRDDNFPGSTENRTYWARWSQIYSITYSGFTESETSEWPKNYIAEELPLTLPIPTKNDGSIFGGWYEGDIPDNSVTSIPLGSTGNKEYSALWGIGILSTERAIPDSKPDDELSVVALASSVPIGFTAGPNPVAKSSGVVNFFRQGKRIHDGMLTVYDALGNFVIGVNIADNSFAAATITNNNGHRRVGSWNLRDSNGYLVSDGVYLVKGMVISINGKKEAVSLVLSVR